jgi:hypothetical protein
MTFSNRKVRFTGLLLVGICLLSIPMPGQTAGAGKTLSFALNFVKQGAPLPIKVGKQEVRFRKEPAWGNDKILRRALVVGSEKSDFIGMAFNLTRRTLQLDLNQDLDLTNDPAGVFEGKWPSGNSSYIYFNGVQLDIHKNGMNRPSLLDIYVSNGDVSLIYVRSSYQGEIELYGEKWRMQVSDNLDGVIDREDRFSISSLASSAAARSERTEFVALPVPKRLFLGGRQYQVEFTFARNEDVPSLTAGFSEINSPLAELILDGNSIQRLVLESADAGLVVLDTPAKPISLPAGKYRIQSIALQGSLPYTINASNVSQIPAFTLTAGAPYHLKAGGPLRSGVTAVPSGSLLKLSYDLKGMGGESYSVANLNRSQPPKWIVYKGDHQVASGYFTYG